MSNPVNLPPSPVKGIYPGNDRLHDLHAFRWANDFIPRHHYISRFRPGSLVIDVVEEIETERKTVEQQYKENEKSLKAELDQQVIGITGSLKGLDQRVSIERQLSAIERLLEQKQAARDIAWKSALAFYGVDPVSRTSTDYLRAAHQPSLGTDPKQAWLASYKAAFEARLLAQSIDQLRSRAQKLTIEKIQAEQRLHGQAQNSLDRNSLEIQRLQAELAQARHALQVGLQQAWECLEHCSHHRFDAIDPSTATAFSAELEDDIAALLQAAYAVRSSRQGVETSILKLGAPAKLLQSWVATAKPFQISDATCGAASTLSQQTFMFIDNHHATWPEESARIAEYIEHLEAALSEVRDGLVRMAALEGLEIPQLPVTYSLTASAAGLPQVITPSPLSMAVFASKGSVLRKGLGHVLPKAGLAGKVLHVASLLAFSMKLGQGERHGISVPFTDMTLSIDWEQLKASIGESIPLPIRLISGLLDGKSQIEIATTGSDALPADVPVRAATWDAEQGAWRFTTDGPGPITVLWTPEQQPADNSTATVPSALELSGLYPGRISIQTRPQILPFPELDDIRPDDYIVVFPADSGLEPVYLMFKSPRDYAGVATGTGQNISGTWLGTAGTQQGSPIPSRIADHLRGRTFSNWDRMREAIWKAVAADAELSQQFIPSNVVRMREGLAPMATSQEHNKSKKSFELHHVHQIAKGGAVYDIDNIVVMTPKQHAEAHKGGSQQ
ncbi:S-type pyocin domain-containing protein [Pseudomonas sp. 148P]|uniref:S-type pyocin domain-containing protein n=1 Tax=Pseudomonas ulcerans TaxID=3115852 RepID=A0ABU7HMM6_9PSED|nr:MULTISPECIES: S-type pyocin domain-containing protein [unclassified Pseudomonas]MEE1921657.1 S-type pyocin domain-containing protein [Pseudomonas sp. 147P]MEE1932784.1 S-type pyocin domain-containing protein [Pseudomonas sp. 148P]